MEFTNGTSSSSTTQDNIFINDAEILTCEILYGEKKSWQKYADDISVELTLDIGKSFHPSFYMGGKFKVDDQSGLVTGWSTAYKIKLFFEAIGQKIKLTKDAGLSDQKLPEEAADYCIGKEFKRLSYKSTKTKPTGENKWKDWQQTFSINTPNNEAKSAFLTAVTNGWIKDFLAPENDIPFDDTTKTVDTVNAEMPL